MVNCKLPTRVNQDFHTLISTPKDCARVYHEFGCKTRIQNVINTTIILYLVTVTGK